MPKKILIADDEADYRKLVQMALGTSDFEIYEADDGRKTLEQIRSISPDLLILDINMPHMDGFKVCEKIRQDPTYRHLPIIMLTVRKTVPAQTKGLQIGADDYVVKPFEQEELVARVKSVLSRSQ